MPCVRGVAAVSAKNQHGRTLLFVNGIDEIGKMVDVAVNRENRSSLLLCHLKDLN